MTIITLPNEWTPRPHQLPALQAFDSGQRKQLHIWHRRAGKDSFGLNLGAKQSHLEIGSYWHLFPQQNQARKAIWSGVNPHTGKRIIDQAFPKELRAATLKQEMMIELKCGSTWQMAGSDQYDSLVGSSPKGVVFSEWALCDPAAWDYIRPIIKENGGWVVFITTFRGQNHAYRMWKLLRENPEWYVSLYTVNDTKREDGSPILTEKDIEDERREGMSEAMIQQEYYCSPMAAFEGSYYANLVADMEKQGRLGPYAYNPAYPLYVGVDLGFSDHMGFVFGQPMGNQHNIIGSRYWRLKPLSECIADCRTGPRPLPWFDRVAGLILPPDPNVQHIEKVGIPVIIAPKVGVHPGIDIVKDYLPLTNIDNEVRPWTDGEPNNAKLIDALNGYRTEQNETQKAHGVFQKQPAHTWESHLADAVRYYFVTANAGLLGLKRGRDTNAERIAEELRRMRR